MSDKKFDSAESFVEFIKNSNMRMEDLYIGYIDTMVKFLSSSPSNLIHGAPPADFFIQGLIAISADPEVFKSALDEYLKKRGYIV